VLPHGRFERRQVHGAHRSDHQAMLELRLFRSMHQHATKKISANPIPVREHALGHVPQHRQARHRGNPEVELPVHVSPLRQPLRRQSAVHPVDKPRQRTQLLRIRALRHQARGDDFQTLEHGEDVLNGLPRNRGNRRAGMRHDHHEPFGLQHLDGLADGNRADVQLAREIVDDHPLAGRQIAAHDRVPQGLVREFLFRAVPRVPTGGDWHVEPRLQCSPEIATL
jgi:hypothetical protein